MPSSDPLAEILGGLLGGVTQQPGSGASTPAVGQAQGPDLAGLLSAVMGGAAPQAGAPAAANPSGQPAIGDIVSAVLGGNHAGIANSDVLNPISEAVSAKTGINSTVSHAVVAFAAAALVQEMANRRQGQGQSLDVHELINRANTGQGLDPTYLDSTGLPQQLAQQAGIDPKTASQGLRQALTMMAPMMNARPKKARQS